MKITLCIPTMDRYNTFLINNLPKYLQNNLINEIVIVDDNSDDYMKIKENFNNDKIKLYQNKERLGPFLNKCECIKYSTNEWIALIDSDNYADYNYFNIVHNFINSNDLHKYVILAPCYAKPRFNYTSFSDNIFTKNNLNKSELFMILMNTGNYVLNKNLITELDLSNEINNIQMSSACDVIYMNTLFFEQYPNFTFYIINELHYEHTVHHGIYIQTHNNFIEFNNTVYNRFLNL